MRLVRRPCFCILVEVLIGQIIQCCTPLHLAAAEGNVGPVTELLKSGASVMLRNDKVIVSLLCTLTLLIASFFRIRHLMTLRL